MHWIDVRKTLEALNCVREGEFLFALKSGRVASKYIDIDPLLTYPDHLRAVMNMLMKDVHGFDVIAGPAVGAIPLVYSAAEMAGSRFNHKIRTVFVDKDGDDFKLKRQGFAATVQNKRVVIVEDIGSTGESALHAANEVRKAGGDIVSFHFIWIRDAARVNAKSMGAPTFSLVEEPVESFIAQQHPAWGIWPLVMDLGHPNKFPEYPGPKISLL